MAAVAQDRSMQPASSASIVETVLMKGDLSQLSPEQRVQYYLRVCESLGLNPLTRPFDYIVLNGRLTLYAKRDATDQIRASKRISVTIVSRERVEDLYIVTARATTPDGRSDEAIGAVSIAGLRGDALANAIMRAETKAKRRVTLSIAGLGWMDETEVGSVAEATAARVNPETGEVLPALPSTPAPPPGEPTTQQPQQPVDAAGAQSVPVDHATDKQLKAIYAKARSLGATPEDMRELIHQRYGVASSKDLTKEQASEVLDLLTDIEQGRRDWPLAAEGTEEGTPT